MFYGIEVFTNTWYIVFKLLLRTVQKEHMYNRQAYLHLLTTYCNFEVTCQPQQGD